MTDIAAIEKDSLYRNAVDKLWHNMVNKKTYIIGGIGARHEGESFGDNYELPNLTAYSETCAAIGSVYWNNRLFNLTGEVKYTDVLERTLYNGLIAGLSLDGTKFFYPNPLEADGKYKFNQGACTREHWFDCSCCPTNLIRFIPAVPGLIYARQADTLYVNLYVANTAKVDLVSTSLNISQETSYPWSGAVRLAVNPENEGSFTLKMRVPGWARNEVLPGDLYRYSTSKEQQPLLKVNGEVIAGEIQNGYFVLARNWKKGDVVEVEFPMEVREVLSSGQVKENIGKVALEYGPLVYALEEADNSQNFESIKVANGQTFLVQKDPDLLNGVNTLKGKTEAGEFLTIPYYAWSNRGIEKMRVWIPKGAVAN